MNRADKLAPLLILVFLFLHVIISMNGIKRIMSVFEKVGMALYLKLATLVTVGFLIVYIVKRLRDRAFLKETCYRVYTARYAPKTMVLNDISKFSGMLEALSKRKDVALVRYTIHGQKAVLCIRHKNRELPSFLETLVTKYTRTIGLTLENPICKWQKYSDSTDLTAKLNNLLARLEGSTLIVNQSIFTIQVDDGRNNVKDRVIRIDLGDDPLYARRIIKLASILDSLDKGKYNVVIIATNRKIAEISAEMIADKIEVDKCYVLIA